jgi:membrane protein implicated in regulation of membrane protease activity
LKDTIVYGSVGIVETVVTVAQTNEVLQTVQIIISCVAGAFAIAYTIWKWYKRATSKDSPGGEKITKEEVGDLITDVKEEASNIKDEVSNK